MNVLKKVLVKLGRRPGPETLVDSKTGCSKVTRPQGKAGEMKPPQKKAWSNACSVEIRTRELRREGAQRQEEGDTAEGEATRAN